VYIDTTNPALATGDGVAIAAKAGAELADMEFYQFHPTALSLPGVPRFLLSEALRGEGAMLRNSSGERFMERYDARLELAPRDIVARAVAREGMGAQPGEHLPVYLDMRHVTGIDLHKRFPGISAFLAQHGLDLHRDLIPVRPAAHYMMGGVRTDLDGRTSLPGLYAAGEAACTGLHGANRLASNSLLEGLVFGARAAAAMRNEASAFVAASPIHSEGAASAGSLTVTRETVDQLEEILANLRGVMAHYAGLLRDAKSLEQGIAARQRLHDAFDAFARNASRTRRLCEAESLLIVSDAILRSALARRESRGAHFRSDYPKRDDADFQKHSVFRTGQPVRFEHRA
jgi:L-aspartate oxidase